VVQQEVQRTVEPERWFAWLEQQKEGLSPERAAIVDVRREHVVAEKAQDVDRIMAHMTDDVLFRRFGAVGNMAESMNYDEIRAMFTKAFATGWPDFEMEPERFVVTDNMVLEDGDMWMTLDPAALALRADVPDDIGGSKLLVTYRLAVIFEFRDGKMSREDSYRGPIRVVGPAL
jgi:hypothetical protein